MADWTLQPVRCNYCSMYVATSMLQLLQYVCCNYCNMHVATSMLQHTATYCSMLNGALYAWARVLQCVAVCCSVSQCVTVCCSVLQCVAVCQAHCMHGHGLGNATRSTYCNILLQQTCNYRFVARACTLLFRTSFPPIVKRWVQHTATRCNILQHMLNGGSFERAWTWRYNIR